MLPDVNGSHLDATPEITDRATIIHEGEVLFEGSPDAIRADPDVRRVYLGESFA